MKKFTVYYENLFEDDLDMLATTSRFRIVEPTPYDDSFIETIFENGIDLMDYYDKNKLLQDDEDYFQNINAWIFRSLSYIFPVNAGA